MPKLPKNFPLLDTLEQRGFLSAERMVEQVIHIRKSKFGSQRIVHELREKGIPENLIAAALPNMKETEQERAREVWRKKFGAMPADAKELGRQMRFLMGRGFRGRSDTSGLASCGQGNNEAVRNSALGSMVV